MLISRVPEEDGNGRKESRAVDDTTEDNAREYHTASELFEIMANNLNLRSGENDLLTTSDLLLIYKNVDLGNKLMSNNLKRKPPNQYVESIVYDDLESDSEISEINSSEDIHNLMMINDERINLLTQTSFENTLCQKIRNLELFSNSSSANITIEYDGKFAFKHPYLKTQRPYIHKQLRTLNPKDMVKPELPVTLLDYICNKRFEEHFNFDMDNIIRYVKLTIEQLKRISNGDFLTEKAKAKWRELDNEVKKAEIVKVQKVLANTKNIPLHVERKVSGLPTKWDDLMHSSVDMRSLSKILEKKIIVEVPKTICGSYKLFSKCCNDNLIIRCKTGVPSNNKDSPKESRVDLLVQLNRSGSGHVTSNINSIIILHKYDNTGMLPLLSRKSSESENAHESDFKEEKVSELQLEKYRELVDAQNEIFENNDNTMTSGSICSVESISGGLSSYPTGSEYQSYSFRSCGDRSPECVAESGLPLHTLHADELCLNIKKMNMTSLPEESNEDNSSGLNKKRSPTRNRIKSPYENKSFVIEEKKRRRLLEVRQRREKNKLALSANACKVNKHKFPVPPQTSSSVTKLSITNKSFYNSIYGENMDLKPNKIKTRKECISELSSNNADSARLPPEVHDSKIQKYVNKSFYLDNAVTEMMYLDMKNQDRCSEASSTNDYKMHFKILTKLLTPSDSKNAGNNADLTRTTEKTSRYMEENNKQRFLEGNDKQRFNEENTQETGKIGEVGSPSNVKHNNTPNVSPMVTEAKPSESEICNEKDPKKATTTAEFRKSIDKIYELINKLGKSDGNETKLCKSKFTAVERPAYNDGAGETSTIQCSDSGTSVKHQLTSSNPSCFSFGKTPVLEEIPPNSPSPKASPSVPASKVIISSKSQNPRIELDKSKKDRKRADSAGAPSNSENPLKAITQFLHEIDNVQKNRSRAMTEKGRKPEVTFADMKVDGRDSRPISRKGLKTEKQRTEHSIEKPPRVIPKERKMKVPIIMQPPLDSRSGTKTVKKKVVDIVDEIKEARGEAVRGPSKLSSRLNSLAQPRKAYVEAQIEEFQARYGKSIVTDRLQKLSGSPSGPTVCSPPKNTCPKYRRRRNSPPTGLLPKQSSNSQPAVLEKPLKKNKCDIVIPSILNKPPSNHSTRNSSPESTKTIKKKKGVPKNHEKLFSPNEFISNGKSRVPFIPNEIELASIISSVGESSAIVRKIHEMIDVIVPSPSKVQQSIVEAENKEINANLREKTANEIICDKCQPKKQSENEKFAVDYYHERAMKIKRDYIIGDTIPEEKELAHENSEEDISQALKTALFRRVSTGSFHKRYKHKNPTLTPKDSMQQVLLLQSGDSNSVILRSTISQNLKITNSKSDLSCLSELTNLDLRFTPFPLQMPIVGYSFPIYDFQRTCQNQLQDNNLNDVNNAENISTNNISIQCYKGQPVDQFSELVDEFDMKELNLLKASPSVIVEESEETKSEFAAGNEKPEIKEVKKAEKTVISEQQTTLLEVCDVNEEEYRDKISEDNDKSSESCMDKVQSKECVSIISTGQSSTMEYTTSLDVLVGLLDEIQNITTCQSQMANTDADDTEEQIENMEAILKSAADLEHVQEPRNIISISSLDKLRQLESNASILSFYLSSNSRKDNIENSFANFNLRPLREDKEVSAMLPQEFDNKCINVPSQLFPLTVSHSTNVSSSLIGVLSQPSSHSLLTYNEYPLQSAMSMTSLKKINLIKLPNKRKEDEVDMPVVVFKHRQLNEGTDRKMRSKKVTSLKTDKQKFVIRKKSLKVDSGFDPVMKMKRDILVTVYSVLVFTVFAALSFPEILYRA